MGDEADGAVVVAQGIGQDLPRGNVQVIGRLIHKEKVARLYEQLGQCHPGLLATRQDGNGLLNIIAAEQESAQYCTEILLRLSRRCLL